VGTLSLASVETPAGVVDLARVRRNLSRVMAYLREHDLAWRPHVKTHKSLGMARLQLRAGACGLTVATPREAEVMAAVSDDLLLAYPPVGDAKLKRLMALPTRVRLSVALDSVAVLEPLARAARDRGREVDVRVEVDTGMGRVGVQGVEPVVEVARRVASERGVHFTGLLFYSGHIRGDRAEDREASQRMGEHLERIYEALDAADLAPGVVSGGSSPTLWQSHLIPGLTEVRAGTCIYNDREQVAVGSASDADLAYTVLATVVSTQIEGRAAVDAGSKALSRESRAGDGTFGALLDRPEVRVMGVSEEHGLLDLSGTDWRPQVGDRVRVVPDHVCVSVNLQDRILVLDPEDGSAADAVDSADRVRPWPLEARGRLES
jgi:D-serine deaminase-like pyridoxal phosphate-dependent protein